MAASTELQTKKLNAIGIIPARWGSTRFPGKPLEKIAGRPLLQWVIRGAKTSRRLSEIFVATDDERIAQLATESGARWVMTDSELPTGTDRIWQASQKIEKQFGVSADLVVNIQGDEPLIEGELLDRLVEPFLADANIEMATLGRPLDRESLISENTAKIVLNARDEAIYFSRYPIPYSRTKPETLEGAVDAALKHIGIYAYRRDFLGRFCSQAPAPAERMESLEQLRALYLGARIKVVRVESDSWGVDVPEDIPKIEAIMKSKGKDT